ncbi:MAG: hypothetical protein EBQ96_04260 [Proteobacteria bacterium]|nr:hypothetical protein [Pseudomonadota bacterium]
MRTSFFLILLTIFAAFMAGPARAALSVDVSSDVIGVTTGFNGTKLTVFGTQDQDGDIVIMVEGPPKTMTVHKKTAIFGLWTNTDKRRFANMPSYYELAASVPLDEVAAPDILQPLRIGLTHLLIAPSVDDGTAQFSNALVRIQQDMGLYGKSIKPVTYTSPRLYKVPFELPANVAPGHYTVSAFLFRDGALIEQAGKSFEVVPEGLSAQLRYFAQNFGLLYGLAGVLMALVAGWLATVLLKRE